MAKLFSKFRVFKVFGGPGRGHRDHAYTGFEVSDGLGGYEAFQVSDGLGGYENFEVRE